MSDHPQSTWTDEQETTLRQLWSTGLSARQIAIEMACGHSRSAIIGKVHRMQLPKRARHTAHTTQAQRTDARMKREPGKPHGNRNQPKANAIVARAARRAPTPPPEPFDMEDGSGVDVTHLVGLMDLDRSSCRWPIGSATGSAQLFCGKHAAVGSYCPEHTKRAGYGFGNGARP